MLWSLTEPDSECVEGRLEIGREHGTRTVTVIAGRERSTHAGADEQRCLLRSNHFDHFDHFDHSSLNHRAFRVRERQENVCDYCDKCPSVREQARYNSES